MQNSIVTLTFFCFWVEILFLGKIGPKNSQIVSLRWNLVPNLIWIFRTQWWSSLYPVLTGSKRFLEICFKNWNCWSLNLEPRLIQICRIQWGFLYFYFLGWKYHFWVKMVRKFKIVSLPWLFQICQIWW